MSDILIFFGEVIIVALALLGASFIIGCIITYIMVSDEEGE